MERYYRIEFTATLEKMSLAFKMQCEIEVYWKRGQKVAQTGKVPFRNCVAHFNKQLTISCNMVLDTKSKTFKEKLTKFAIVIFTEKGNKQAGEVLFDVAPFLNERNQSKSYELGLLKCPDKNAKICFSLRGSIMEEKTFDTLSESSLVSVDIQQLTEKKQAGEIQQLTEKKQAGEVQQLTEKKQAGEVQQLTEKKQAGEVQLSPALRASSNSNKATLEVISLPQQGVNKSSTSIMSKNDKKPELASTRDRPSGFSRQQPSQRSATDRTEISAQTIKQLQIQNKKMRQQLKKKQQLRKENEQLKRKLKDDDYDSCKEYKKKIEQGKKEIETLNQESKGGKKINDEIKKLQKQILKCKEHIMKVFNEAEKFGPQAMDKIHQACGFKEY